MNNILCDTGHSLTDPRFSGHLYVFAAGSDLSVEKDEAYQMLGSKHLLWINDVDSVGGVSSSSSSSSSNKKSNWRPVTLAELKVVFKFKLLITCDNVMNGDALEKMIQTKLNGHPHKLWEGLGNGRMGARGSVGKPGSYHVGVTYTQKALPANWRVSKTKPG
jgi:hypothetical protein